MMLAAVTTTALVLSGLVVGAAPASAASGNVYHVTIDQCGGPGSIKQAVLDANAHPGADTISIDVPVLHFGPGCTMSGAPEGSDPAVLTFTDAVTIEGNGSVFRTTQAQTDTSGNVNNANEGRCGKSAGDLPLAAASGFADVGTYGADNAAVRVIVQDARFTGDVARGGFSYLAKVNRNASLEFDSVIVDNVYNGQDCGQSMISAYQGANVAVRNSDFEDIYFQEYNALALNAHIRGLGQAGNLTIENSRFYGMTNASAVQWSGGPTSRVNIVGSQFMGSGGFTFTNVGASASTMHATIANSLVRLGSPWVASDLLPGDVVHANSGVGGGLTTLTLSATTVVMDMAGCHNTSSGGMCITALPVIIGARDGSTLQLQHTAVGVSYPMTSDNNRYTIGALQGSHISVDKFSWVQSTNFENEAALRNIIGPDGLTGPTTVGLPATFVPGIAGMTPITSGGLVDAIPDAVGTANPIGANALLNPIDATPLLFDVLGNQRWDSNGAANIGAIQFGLAPYLSLVSVGDQTVNLSWTKPIDDPTSGAATGYVIKYRVAGTSNVWSRFPVVGADTLSSAVTGLTNGVTYEFVVAGVNGSGDFPVDSNKVVGRPLGAFLPPAPAAIPGDATVGLSWIAPDAGGRIITSYAVFYRKVGDPNWLSAGQVTDTFADVNGLSNGTPYEFGVVALAQNSDQSPMGVVTATPMGPVQPPVLTATPAAGRVGLAWTAPDRKGHPGPATYELYYRAVGSTAWRPAVALSQTRYTVLGLVPGIEYEFAAKTKAADSVLSVLSAPVKATPFGDVVAPLTATPGDTVVDLAWTDTEFSGAVGYVVLYRPQGDLNWTSLPQVPLNKVTQTVTGLVNGTVYEFQVLAVGSGTVLGATNVALSMPFGTPQPPMAPIDVPDPTATASDGQVGLAWPQITSSSHAISGYQVGYRPAGTSAWTSAPFVPDVSGTVTTAVTGLTNGTVYEFSVTAVSADGATSNPGSVIAKPVGPIAAPVVTATGGDGTVSLVWPDVDLNGHLAPMVYTVEYRAVGAATWQSTVGGPTASAAVANLTNGTAYEFRVVAIAYDGASSNPGTATATPYGALGTPKPKPTAGSKTVSLTWPTPATGGHTITSYVISFGPVGGPMKTSGRPTGSWSVNGLTNGKPYRFCVTAVAADGARSAAGCVNATPTWGPQQTSSTRVYYAANAATLTATQKATLDRLIAGLPKNRQIVRITITGYVQRTANTHNDAVLSHNRALAVQQYLRGKGISAPTTLSGKGAETTGKASRAADVTVFFRV